MKPGRLAFVCSSRLALSSSVKTGLSAADAGTTTPEYGISLPRSNGVIVAFVQTACRSGRPSGMRGIVQDPSDFGVWPAAGVTSSAASAAVNVQRHNEIRSVIETFFVR